jgi:hypothetical protein
MICQHCNRRYVHERCFYCHPVAEQFPPDLATVLDRSWAEREHSHELDADGRFVRGLYEGMTPSEVMADREAFRRCMPD